MRGTQLYFDKFFSNGGRKILACEGKVRAALQEAYFNGADDKQIDLFIAFFKGQQPESRSLEGSCIIC